MKVPVFYVHEVFRASRDGLIIIFENNSAIKSKTVSQVYLECFKYMFWTWQNTVHLYVVGIQFISYFFFFFRSTIRALIKNFSIASFFPAFITLLFFQHNRTAYDIVAGTIVVKRNGVRWCPQNPEFHTLWNNDKTICIKAISIPGLH